MTNALYDKARELFLTGGLNWSSDTIKVALVDSADYTLSLSTHDFYDDVPSGGVVALSSALSSKTVAAGVADAADVTLTTVTGDQAEYIIGIKDTGTPSTSPLIFCIDTATGLPVTPGGGNIGINFDNGANKIFKL